MVERTPDERRRLVIFGTGSFAEIARLYFDAEQPGRVVAFTATEGYRPTAEFDGLPLVPFETIEQTHPAGEFDMFVAAGSRDMNTMRARLFEMAKAKGYRLVTYVSPDARCWPDAVIGENTFIFEDNTIQPKVRIGDDVVLWSGNHIGHHSQIGDHTFVTSQVVVSGHVRIGKSCFIGVNATIRDNITIGDSCFIGPGTLILKPAAPREVYLEQPSKPHVLKSDQIGF